MIKGEKRPINSQAERAETLAALESVDYVTVFDELDPYRVISALQPDVLVKGGDWPIEKIIGRDVVEARGGKVVNVPYVEGASTTGIIERILKDLYMTRTATTEKQREARQDTVAMFDRGKKKKLLACCLNRVHPRLQSRCRPL